jgi:hypothetical protein
MSNFNSASGEDVVTATSAAKKRTKKSYIKRADPTMVEMLINGENYDLMKSLSKLLKFPNDEKVIEEWMQVIQKPENNILMGGRFNQYVLTYDEFNHIIEFKDENNDEISFGVNVQNINPDFFDYLDIACCINDMIEDYFSEAIIEDCGEFWWINE